MNILYKYRGFISAALAFFLLLFPPVPELEIIAVPVFAFSVFLRVWARTRIGSHSRESELRAPQIVKSGPYSFLKHPLYLSNWLAGISFAILHSGFSEICIIFSLVYLMFLLSLCLQENAFLKKMQHVSQVRIFKPQAKDFFKAILNDRWTWFWQFSLIIIIFALKFES